LGYHSPKNLTHLIVAGTLTVGADLSCPKNVIHRDNYLDVTLMDWGHMYVVC